MSGVSSARDAPGVRGVLAACWLAGLGLAAPAMAEDVALTATRTALTAGQPAEAATVLQAASESPEKRLLAAEVALALGHASDALAGLGISDPADPQRGLARWPAELQGEVAQVAAEALLAETSPVPAVPWLQSALSLGGEHVEVDRCLALYLDAQLQEGHDAAAVRAAEQLWEDWPRSPYRAHGGLVLAHAWAETRITPAREILASIRVDPQVPIAIHLAAAEQLCAILARIHPGQCWVVADQECAYAVAHHVPPGRLALWRALSLASIDPPAGAAALRALPADLAREPAAVQALVQASASQEISVAMRCEGALSLQARGRTAEARAQLEPLAAQDDLALVTLLSLPGVDPLAWCTVPAAARPRAAVALAAELMAAKHAPEAWTVVQRALPATPSGTLPPVTLGLVYWASQCAPQAAQREFWQALLLVQPRQGPSLELGLAWCAEAQRREALPADATAAWQAAAATLPEDHPYFPEACDRAASGLAAAGDEQGALRLLQGPAAWGGDDPAHWRCRFLLAQLAGRLGQVPQALEAARSLLHRGNAEQQQRLEALIHQLTKKMP